MVTNLAFSASAAHQAHPAVSSGSHDGLRAARLLLVDDSLPDLILARRCLLGRAGVGCELATARSSREGLDIMLRAAAAGQAIDLVLLDINMPGDDGFVMLDHIRGHTCLRRTPAIICTGSSHAVDRSQAVRRGAVGYIHKPASLEGLRDVLDHLPLFDVITDGDGLKLMTVMPDRQGVGELCSVM